MKIYLPAYGGNRFYLVGGSITRQDNVNVLILTVLRQAEMRELTPAQQGGSAVAVDQSPVAEFTYTVSFDIDYLADRLCGLCRSSTGRRNFDICGYYVYRNGEAGWLSYAVLFLTSCSERQSESQTYAVVKNFGRRGEPWIVAITRNIPLAKGRSERFQLTISGRHASWSFTATVDAVEKLNVFGKAFVDEVSSFSRSQCLGGTLELGEAVVEAIYMGSLISLRTKDRAAYLPVVVHYDIVGSSSPRTLHPSAKYYRIKLNISDDLLYSNVRSVLLDSDKKVAVKLLLQNVVAGSVFRAFGCGRWVTEREISASIFGREIVITTPIISRILGIYSEIYGSGANYSGSGGLRSLLKRWQNAVVKYKCRDLSISQERQRWIDYFTDCIENSQTPNDFRSCLMTRFQYTGRLECRLIESRSKELFAALTLYDTLAFSAILLGSHGVAHLLGKSAGLGRDEFSERIAVKLNPRKLPMLNCAMFGWESYEPLNIDGLFNIEVNTSLNSVAEVEITVYDLKGTSMMNCQDLSSVLGKLLQDIGGCGSPRDACKRAWEEESRRVERMYRVIAAQDQLASSLDQELKRRPQEVTPPRDIFRFMLRDIIRGIGASAGQSSSKILQYVWPRHIPSCSDGCQRCVLMQRNLCVYPPLHEEMKVSKRMAIMFLRMLCPQAPQQ